MEVYSYVLVGNHILKWAHHKFAHDPSNLALFDFLGLSSSHDLRYRHGKNECRSFLA